MTNLETDFRGFKDEFIALFSIIKHYLSKKLKIRSIKLSNLQT